MAGPPPPQRKLDPDAVPSPVSTPLAPFSSQRATLCSSFPDTLQDVGISPSLQWWTFNTQGRLPSCVCWAEGSWRTGLSVREAARVDSSLIFYEFALSTDVQIYYIESMYYVQ